MTRIVARILLCLSVILAMAMATGNQAGAVTACPYARMIATSQAHGALPEMAQETAQSGAVPPHGHFAMPEACKHGCQIIVAIQPHVTATSALPLRPIPIRADTCHLPSLQTPPVERPPNPLA